MGVINIPNSLTIVRIVLIPAYIASIIYGQYRYALALFLLAALTDALDGLIARMTNQKTALGTFLDPLADKFLLVSSFILFAIFGWIPKWLAITVISRDVIVVIGWLLLYMIMHYKVVEPVLLGKIAIVLQVCTLAYILLNLNLPGLPALPGSAFLLTALITALSGLQYIYRGFKVSHAA